jgi:hypothetical protein
VQITTDESDNETEHAPSDAEAEAVNDETGKHVDHNTGFPTEPDAGDDADIFTMLRRTTVLDDQYRPPREIGLGLLIQFLSLVDKIPSARRR